MATTPQTPQDVPTFTDVQVQPGATVDASDGRLGIVDEVMVRPETGELAYLVVRRGWTDQRVHIAASAIETIVSPSEVRLRLSRDDVVAQGASVHPEAHLGRAEGTEIRIPVLEERLRAETRPVDLGELRVHKRVETTQEVVRQPTTRDSLTIERVAIHQPIDAPVATRTEGDWLIIPVMEEVLVVEKRLMLKEEVRIRKTVLVEEQEVRETVRHEHVEFEDATARGVTGLEDAPPNDRPAL